MSSIDPLLFIALSGALFFVAGVLVFRLFRSTDKDWRDNSTALKEALRDLSVKREDTIQQIELLLAGLQELVRMWLRELNEELLRKLICMNLQDGMSMRCVQCCKKILSCSPSA